MLTAVTSGQPSSEELQSAAAIADATIRDELLAPRFLTKPLANCIRAAGTSGAKVTVDIAHHPDPALTDTARRLLAATMAEANAVTEVKL